MEINKMSIGGTGREGATGDSLKKRTGTVVDCIENKTHRTDAGFAEESSW
jgi:hypothetical protein